MTTTTRTINGNNAANNIVVSDSSVTPGSGYTVTGASSTTTPPALPGPFFETDVVINTFDAGGGTDFVNLSGLITGVSFTSITINGGGGSQNVTGSGFAEIRIASTASAASEQLAAWAPELLILDLGLPDGDGLAILEFLRRTGTTVAVLVVTADADPERFAAVCAQTPAVHRFPGSMAKRVQDLAREIVERYHGDTAGLWTEGDPDGPEVLRRLKALPGFGEQKARIFLALLGKQYGVTPKGWRAAAGDYGRDGTHMSVADVVDKGSLEQVRAYKKKMKAAKAAAAKV
jgi:uncharacterized HhH-GPD family protein